MALSHGFGIYASAWEPEIEALLATKSASIGGNGRPTPVLVVELHFEALVKNERDGFIASLHPYIIKFNVDAMIVNLSDGAHYYGERVEAFVTIL